ncbi:MAG: hypothetical protein H7831_16205 [Magnetococcus sp. WYHC-3]
MIQKIIKARSKDVAGKKEYAQNRLITLIGQLPADSQETINKTIDTLYSIFTDIDKGSSVKAKEIVDSIIEESQLSAEKLENYGIKANNRTTFATVISAEIISYLYDFLKKRGDLFGEVKGIIDNTKLIDNDGVKIGIFNKKPTQPQMSVSHLIHQDKKEFLDPLASILSDVLTQQTLANRNPYDIASFILRGVDAFLNAWRDAMLRYINNITEHAIQKQYDNLIRYFEKIKAAHKKQMFIPGQDVSYQIAERAIFDDGISLMTPTNMIVAIKTKLITETSSSLFSFLLFELSQKQKELSEKITWIHKHSAGIYRKVKLKKKTK